MPIPPDTRAPGDTGHVADHNNIADELTAIAGGAVTAGGDLTGTAGAAQVTGTHLASALPVAQGGTGQTAQAAALTALAGTQSAGKVLRSDGTSTALAVIQAGDVPTLNQNTTGTAAGLSSTLAVGSGGTGQVSAASALNALGGAAVAGDIGGTSASPQVTATHLASALPVAQGGTGSTARNFAGLLAPTAVKTTAYTAAAGDFVPVDTTSGNVTVTLPSAPADLTVVGVKQVIQGGTNTVTITCGGSDVFNKASGATSGTLTLLAQGMLLQYKASGGIWYIVADDLALPQLDTRYPGLATASTYTADQYFKSGRPWFDVIAFGADPTGVADSTTAFNNCITAITGAANPATTTRVAKGPMYVPAGTYKITSDLNVQSVQNFVMIGAGAGQASLKLHGTGFTTAALLIDGSLDGVFSGFEITGDGTEQVTDAIRLDWTTAAQRSTSANCFRDIRIRNLNFVTGISLEGNGSRQVDGTVLQNIVVTGQQTAGAWSTSGNWQNGLAFGNGTFGNNYDHTAHGVCAGGCYYAFKVNVSGVSVYSSQPAGNATDFYINPGAQCVINDIQSQNSQRFLVQPASFSAMPVNVSSVVFASGFVASDGQVIQLTGGTWQFNGFRCLSTLSGSYVPAVIVVAGDGANRPGIVILNNITLNNTLTAGILPTASEAQMVVTNYSNYNTTTGTYAVTPLVWYAGSGWVTPGSTTVPDVQFFTATGTPTATWTKLPGAQAVFVSGVGSGGGAGSGASGASGTIQCGGGGGGAGVLVSRQFIASDLPGTPITVTVGAAPNGGGSVTGMSSPRGPETCGITNGSTSVTDVNAIAGDVNRTITGTGIPANAYITAVNTGTNTYTISAAATATNASASLTIGTHTSGNAGTVGNQSSFGTYLRCPAGGQGQGGTTTTGTGGADTLGLAASSQIGSGSSASVTGGAGVSVNQAPLGPPGGPSGGGITVTPAAGAGAAGNYSLLAGDAVAGTPGAVGGASPGSGTASGATKGAVGPAPGSGAASTTGAAQAGADALANSGAGGGGGGASLNGNASGGGGKGGSGWLLVVTYFQ